MTKTQRDQFFDSVAALYSEFGFIHPSVFFMSIPSNWYNAGSHVNSGVRSAINPLSASVATYIGNEVCDAIIAAKRRVKLLEDVVGASDRFLFIWPTTGWTTYGYVDLIFSGCLTPTWQGMNPVEVKINNTVFSKLANL